MSPELNTEQSDFVISDDLHEEALKLNDAYTTLEEGGVKDMARQQVEAHGKIMDMADAIAGCDPFAKSIQGTIEGLKAAGVTDPEMIKRGVRKTMEAQASSAPATVTSGMEKK